MSNMLKKSISSEGSTSNMRILVTSCVLFALFLGLIVTSIWVYAFFMDKDVKDLGLMLGLTGTFLGTLVAKAAQSFPENR